MTSIYDVTKESFPGITEEMNLRGGQVMRRTWEAIAWDVGEEGECTRKDVVELVLDADRMAMFGDDFEAAQYIIWFQRFHKKKWNTFVRTVFPYARY